MTSRGVGRTLTGYPMQPTKRMFNRRCPASQRNAVMNATMNATIPTNTRTGGQMLADALRIHGCDTAFCVAGESYLALLDALYDHPEFKLYTCRHEGGAANMAEAYAKLTGKPGVV